ncbi:hypothetical protein CGSHiR3021_01462 [Haemophilus influenzae 22.4-21]|uniref:Uncharacterized protein n=1 Tax=Haemophilus influenzae 22.4-21 TaxID=375063 RepID=A4NZC2_HAEIF|nr:hypothetical protein CGSHiR3021_01462 [Haemophilus influenzae 22.4-21]
MEEIWNGTNSYNKTTAKLLNLSYSTVFSHRHKWGFFQMEGSNIWLVEKSVLEQRKKSRIIYTAMCRSAIILWRIENVDQEK